MCRFAFDPNECLRLFVISWSVCAFFQVLYGAPRLFGLLGKTHRLATAVGEGKQMCTYACMCILCASGELEQVISKPRGQARRSSTHTRAPHNQIFKCVRAVEWEQKRDCDSCGPHAVCISLCRTSAIVSLLSTSTKYAQKELSVSSATHH